MIYKRILISKLTKYPLQFTISILYFQDYYDKYVLFLEGKIPYDKSFKNKDREILVKFLWQIFKFFRYKHTPNILFFIYQIHKKR